MRFLTPLIAATVLVDQPSALAQQPLRVGFIPVMGVAQIFVADGEGWTKQAGIPLNTGTFESGPNMIQALASGTLDVYVAGLAPLLVARAKGIDVRVIAATVVEEMGFAASASFAPYFDGQDAGASVQGVPREEQPSGQARHAADRFGAAHDAELLAVGSGQGGQGRRTKSSRWASMRRSARFQQARSKAARSASPRSPSCAGRIRLSG